MGLPAVEVYGVGQCSLDTIARIDAYPPPNAKCEFGEMVIQGGGPVATAMVALARWGVSCAIAGVIGDDGCGTAIRDSLEGEGVDTRGLRVRPESESQIAFIVAEPASGSRTVFWRRPTGPPLAPAEIDLDVLGRAAVFYTDGLQIEAALFAAEHARRGGVPVVVDAGSLRDGMLDLARQSDCFLASETFARDLVGDEDPPGACRKLAEIGPRVAGVTLGRRGWVAVEGRRVLAGSAHPASVVDTTGCGDVFHAGFTYALLRGWPTAVGLDFGAWAAAAVSTRLGGRTAIPTVADYGPGSAVP